MDGILMQDLCNNKNYDWQLTTAADEIRNAGMEGRVGHEVHYRSADECVYVGGRLAALLRM